MQRARKAQAAMCAGVGKDDAASVTEADVAGKTTSVEQLEMDDGAKQPPHQHIVTKAQLGSPVSQRALLSASPVRPHDNYLVNKVRADAVAIAPELDLVSPNNHTAPTHKLPTAKHVVDLATLESSGIATQDKLQEVVKALHDGLDHAGHSHGVLIGAPSLERTVGVYVLEFGLTGHVRRCERRHHSVRGLRSVPGQRLPRRLQALLQRLEEEHGHIRQHVRWRRRARLHRQVPLKATTERWHSRCKCDSGRAY